MIDLIFKVIGFIYRVCFAFTLWIGIFLGHKMFMNLIKEQKILGQRPDVLYWITFIGFIYIEYYILRLMGDKEKEIDIQYETPKKQGNFSSLGNLDDRYGEPIDPKTYRGN